MTWPFCRELFSVSFESFPGSTERAAVENISKYSQNMKKGFFPNFYDPRKKFTFLSSPFSIGTSEKPNLVDLEVP